MPTKIEWAQNPDGSAGETWNPIRARDKATGKVGTACVKISEGCRNCYAARLNMRNLPRAGTGHDYTAQALEQVEVFLDEDVLIKPLKWKKPRTIFVCSMTDPFADFVPDDFIDDMLAIAALTPRHRYLILTKRAERMGRLEENNGINAGRYYEEANAFDIDDRPELENVRWPSPNVFLGISVEDQKTADERTRQIGPLAEHGWNLWWSAEPLIAPVRIPSFAYHDEDFPSSCWIDWIVAGGESGPGARPMHPEWPRQLRDDAVAAKIPFFFKQWGAWAPAKRPDLRKANNGQQVCIRVDGHKQWCPGVGSFATLERVTQKAAGRLLDGEEWNQLPPWPEVVTA